jgi:hypothetical protein
LLGRVAVGNPDLGHVPVHRFDNDPRGARIVGLVNDSVLQGYRMNSLIGFAGIFVI